MKTHRPPTYLRIEVTSRCPLRCAFCHAEGNGASDGSDLPSEALVACVSAALGAGMQKVKFLGGEPLVRGDLPTIVAAARAVAPAADLSLITSGVGAPRQLEALFAAGLDRANMSIHGWGLAAFAERGGTPVQARWRALNLEALVARGRPLKLNYVYRGPHDEPDLDALLTWAASRPVVVGVLDDLGRPELGPEAVVAALARLRGGGYRAGEVPDPHSLATTELTWPDGLRVEVKTSQLGRVAPWRECARCPARARCREGIYAVRLTPDGWLQPCMDRPDWRVPVVTWVATHGVAGASARIERFLEEASA